MRSSFNIDFNICSIDNFLWPRFVQRIGFEKASLAIRQAFDLQHMNGNDNTIPLVFVETCGSCLVSSSCLMLQTGLPLIENSNIIIYSSASNSFQLLKDF